jgi:hypothetical protein
MTAGAIEQTPVPEGEMLFAKREKIYHLFE